MRFNNWWVDVGYKVEVQSHVLPHAYTVGVILEVNEKNFSVYFKSEDFHDWLSEEQVSAVKVLAEAAEAVSTATGGRFALADAVRLNHGRDLTGPLVAAFHGRVYIRRPDGALAADWLEDSEPAA